MISFQTFGYYKVTIERPQRDDNGEVIAKRGKPISDASLRDTELIPISENIDDYFEREIRPFVPDAWIDKKKTKTGYEIPMIRYFYEFPEFVSHTELFAQIKDLEDSIQDSMNLLFEGDKND